MNWLWTFLTSKCSHNESNVPAGMKSKIKEKQRRLSVEDKKKKANGVKLFQQAKESVSSNQKSAGVSQKEDKGGKPKKRSIFDRLKKANEVSGDLKSQNPVKKIKTELIPILIQRNLPP